MFTKAKKKKFDILSLQLFKSKAKNLPVELLNPYQKFQLGTQIESWQPSRHHQVLLPPWFHWNFPQLSMNQHQIHH